MLHSPTLPPAAIRLLAISAAWLRHLPPHPAPATVQLTDAAHAAGRPDEDDALIDEAHADDGPLPPRPLHLHRARLRALWLARGAAHEVATT
jgi:hypothetical protein